MKFPNPKKLLKINWMVFWMGWYAWFFSFDVTEGVMSILNPKSAWWWPPLYFSSAALMVVFFVTMWKRRKKKKEQIFPIKISITKWDSDEKQTFVEGFKNGATITISTKMPKEFAQINELFPALLNEEVESPCNCYTDAASSLGIGKSYTHIRPLKSVIIHLNDAHGWPRERVADWLDTLKDDIDLTIKPASKGN